MSDQAGKRVNDLRKALHLCAGALTAANIEARRVTFTGEWAYLGSMSVGEILDKANAALEVQPATAPVAQVGEWRDMTTAPRDGKPLRLLVEQDAGGASSSNPTEDETRYRTVGFYVTHGDDGEWCWMGWDWAQDCVRAGRGTPVGWMPYDDAPSLPAAAHELADCLDSFWNAAIGFAQHSNDSTVLATIGAMAEGFAAVARSMRERATAPVPAAEKPGSDADVVQVLDGAFGSMNPYRAAWDAYVEASMDPSIDTFNCVKAAVDAAQLFHQPAADKGQR